MRTSGISRATVIAALLLGVLAGVGVGYAASRAAPVWRSEALLAIDEPRALAAADDAGVIDKISRLRYKYVGLVPTERIAAPVATQLGRPVGEVRGEVSASASPNDLLVHVYGTAGTSSQARAVATALATELPEYLDQEQTDNAIPTAQRVVLSVADAPSDPVRISPSRHRVLGAGLVAGLVVALLVLLVAAGVAASRRHRRDDG